MKLQIVANLDSSKVANHAQFNAKKAGRPRALLIPKETTMTSKNTPQAKLTTIAFFQPNYFLENMAVRADRSILVTVANRNELWYIPPPDTNVPVDPVLLSTFSQSAMGIVEVAPDIFYIATSP